MSGLRSALVFFCLLWLPVCYWFGVVPLGQNFLSPFWELLQALS